jgi:hypothetical protein
MIIIIIIIIIIICHHLWSTYTSLPKGVMFLGLFCSYNSWYICCYVLW